MGKKLVFQEKQPPKRRLEYVEKSVQITEQDDTVSVS